MTKEKRRLFSFGLVLITVISIFLSSASSSLAAQRHTTQLTDNDYSEHSPQISGNNVVWSGGGESFLYNGASTVQLTNNDHGDYAPQISGNNIVWYGYDGTDSEIFLYNGSSTVQLTNNDHDDSYPQVSGNNVVWVGDGEIFYYDGSSTTQLTDTGYNERDPQISGKNITWTNGGRIFFYDGSSTKELTDKSGKVRYPQISGNNVVWQGYDGNDWEIYFYNGTSTKRLTHNDHSDYAPQISGNNAVWYGSDGNDYEISYYDGSSVTQLTNNGYHEKNPQISGNNVVWQGTDGNNWEIFFYDGSKTVKLTDNDNENVKPQVSGNNVVWQARWLVPAHGDYMINDYEIFLASEPPVSLWTPHVSTKISKRPTFKVSWSASNAAGAAAYTVRYRWANSRTWKTWKTNTKSKYGYFKGKAGRTVYFRVKAKDNEGNVGWSKVRKTIMPYNEGANIRKKIGFNGYQKSGKSSNYLSSVRYSYKQGHTLVYRLDNTNGIGLVTTKGSNRGKAKIYVDGKYMTTVDAHSSKLKPRQLIYYRNFKTKGTHYLKVVNEGTPGRPRFDVDAVVAGR